jgi:putative acyl-CoA dehydrogenase
MEPDETHEVRNQPPPFVGVDPYELDVALVEAVGRTAAAPWAGGALHELGRLAGSAEVQRWGQEAEANRPTLRAFDRYGHRVDQVDYHPSYHQLMSTAIGHGLHAWAWVDERPGAHAARAAKFLTWYRVDGGHTCPVSMTYSVVPALRAEPDVAAEWVPRLTPRSYDPTFRPVSEKTGVTCGMAMTEKQGGSDVRANTTVARPAGSSGEHLLTGHKWFCSAPMSDAFLMLAQAPEGLSCFLVPRWTPDGRPNTIRIQRLKDKLGDRSNASSEIELRDTWGRLIGEAGHGVRTIIEMVNHTRLDCSLGSTAIMRAGLEQAAWHTQHRDAFGRRLVDQPLMTNVLADLAVESEAATTTVMWLASLFDADDERSRSLRRLALPIIKYWTCKRAPVHAAEAMECLGGNGYVEESGLPRLYRQSPVNGIWEGSGNVICLDVLRAMAREPESLDALLDEVAMAASGDPRLDDAVVALGKDLVDLDEIEHRARHLVERLALVVQASLVVRFAPASVADAFVASRLGHESGRAFGTLPRGADTAAVVERALPDTGGLGGR